MSLALLFHYLLQSFSLHKDTTPPQPNHTVTPTHIEPEQYNTRNKSTIIRKLLKLDVLTFETCWAVNSEIIKQVTSSWSIIIQLLKVYLGAPQLWLSLLNGSTEKKPLQLMTKHSQFPKPYVWEDPKWRTVNVESKRVLLCLRNCLKISALNGRVMRTTVTSKKDFILRHLNHFYPLKAVPRFSRPRNMKYLAQSQARLCRICSENIGAETGLPTSTLVTLSVVLQLPCL